MNRIAGLLVAALLVGCTTSPKPPATSNTPAANTDDPGRLVLEVDQSGGLHVAGYDVASADLPELVKQRHVTSAIVRGYPNAKYGDALKAQAELKAAGVSDVTIVDQHS